MAVQAASAAVFAVLLAVLLPRYGLVLAACLGLHWSGKTGAFSATYQE